MDATLLAKRRPACPGTEDPLPTPPLQPPPNSNRASAFTRLGYRLRLRSLLLGLGVWSWGSSLVGRTWDTLVSLLEEALFE
ncbi:hypothetical protein GPECTOR_26g476 [Gonium pectorale]|uniref:Uncharacterized protein n=1 Tax=Gonium pectorale TaxID=33097 RepID=A0A150GFK7_GONPE|nr:hypothetical protein GPECTOR_26g476 [Gonium pectorale]|eukprot:KXZ48573.1 hypothetical protein GPECTOR_26g476 [Gonium pectorale]